VPNRIGFDTGFVSFVRGWRDIRDDDRGVLWEHVVLDVLCVVSQGHALRYWRDKSGREIDFVLVFDQGVHAVECKVNPDRFDPRSLKVFRQAYPNGHNYVVCPGVESPYDRRCGDLIVRVVGCRDLMREIENLRRNNAPSPM